MKRSELRQIIKEEIKTVLNENTIDDVFNILITLDDNNFKKEVKKMNIKKVRKLMGFLLKKYQKEKNKDIYKKYEFISDLIDKNVPDIHGHEKYTMGGFY